MNDDLRPESRGAEGQRFESPFDVPHEPAASQALHTDERLELLRCDPFEHADERGDARGQD
jgi:hypothetical protein